MFKVLIIDDEPLIREGLKTIVDWGRHGFTICGEAANGREGLRKVRSLQPDLLVLDIKMPAVDGLEMLATLRKEGHNVQALILTGYSEFAYAQQAINLGVLGYILKPIEEEELEAQLKKAYAVIAKLKAENPDVSTLSLVTEKIMAELCWGTLIRVGGPGFTDPTTVTVDHTGWVLVFQGNPIGSRRQQRKSWPAGGCRLFCRHPYASATGGERAERWFLSLRMKRRSIRIRFC